MLNRTFATWKIKFRRTLNFEYIQDFEYVAEMEDGQFETTVKDAVL